MIPKKRAHLFVAAATHPGMSGKNNEDRYAVAAFAVSEQDATPVLFAIVSDGVGGHRAGEVAAEIATDGISHGVAQSDAADPPAILSQAIIQASQAIHAQSNSDTNQEGMGATCACAWIIGSRLYTASVGDSRLYLVRDKKIRQLTTDHTWIQEALEHNIITPEQARGHPRAHIIRRYLGSKIPPEPDLRLRLYPEENDHQSMANQGMELIVGDRLLLCSDGLTDLVEDGEILNALDAVALDAARAGTGLQNALGQLIDLANERGGHDNITVVALEMPESLEATRPLPKVQRRFFSRSTCAAIAVIFLAVIAALVVLVWYATRPRPEPAPSVASETPLVAITSTSTPFDATPTDEIPSPTPTVMPSGTPQATLTPWPTHTPTPIP